MQNIETSEVKHIVSNSYIRMVNYQDWQPGSERQIERAPSYRRDIAPVAEKARQCSRSNVFTMSPARERVKLGSASVRAAVVRDLRMTRRLDRTAGKIGNVLCKRIATPKRSNDIAHFVGATVTPKGKRVAVSKLAANPIAGMMKTSPRANGNFPSRFVTRKDIELSFHDRQEIRSVTRTILALAMEPDAFYVLVEGDKVTRLELPHWREASIPKSLWKVLFKAARAALGMHKVMSRELSLDYFGECGVQLDIEITADSLEETVTEQARASRVLALGSHFRECIEATYKAEKSRKAHKAGSKYRAMLALCELAEMASLGQSTGHGAKSSQCIRNLKADFAAYVAKGEELLRMEPASVALELSEAWAMHAIE